MQVWAHWNLSCDMHLNNLGLISYTFSSSVFSGCALRGGCGSWLLDGGCFVPILSSLRAHCWDNYNVVTWGLQYPLFTDMAGNFFCIGIWELCTAQCCCDCITVLKKKKTVETKRVYYWKQVYVHDTKWNSTEILKFEAEKGLLQGHAKRQVTYAPQTLDFPEFQQSNFKGQVREGAL